jgi:tellurite resistance protein TerA
MSELNSRSKPSINLAKGQRVSLEKSNLIKIVTTWQANKDYDVMALVKYKDGHVETVSAVNNEKMRTNDGAVKHLGDVGVGGGTGTEIIEVRLNDQIDKIVPFAYSARENGAGSFREYGVSVAVDNGISEAVRINAADTSADSNRYTCAFARIVNGPTVSIENIEMYSGRGSERRPAFVNDIVTMDAGPENVWK